VGVAILPRSEATLGGAALAALVLTPRLTRTVALARVAGGYHSAAAEAFITLAREALRRA